MEKMIAFNTLKLQKVMREFIMESRKSIENKTKEINFYLQSLTDEHEQIISKSKSINLNKFS